MTVQFYSSSSSAVTLPIPQEETRSFNIQIKDTLLLSGDHAIDASTHYSMNPAFTCLGQTSDINALVALIGSSGTLVINGSSFSGMFIRSFGPAQLNVMSSYWRFPIGFAQETTA